MKEALSKEAPVHWGSTTTTSKKSISTKNTIRVYSIAKYSWWKVLDTSTILREPTNPTFKLPRALIVAEEESKYVPQKFYFSYPFYQSVFEGIVKRKFWYANGTIKK